MHRRVARLIVAPALAVVMIGSLAACTATPMPSATPASDILTRTLPTDVSAKGVVAAAVLIKIANIEDAIQQGIVTPAEVAEAKQALVDGTLDLWKQRAETE